MSERKEPTRNSRISSAEICRRNGWGAGTLLAGDEGCGVTVIKITAVGDRRILAQGISHAGKRVNWSESGWTLECRDWHVVESPDNA